MPHVNKKTTSEKWKFNSNKKLGLEWLWMDWENYLDKNPIRKIEKTVKFRVKLPHVNKKQLPRNRIFVQTPFSQSTLKLERKKIHAAKPLAFSLHFLFRLTKITTPIWLQKWWKCVNRSLKKRQHPNTIQILWIVKNQEKANNSPSYRCAAIKKYEVLFRFKNLFLSISFPLFHFFSLKNFAVKAPKMNNWNMFWLESKRVRWSKSENDSS